MDKFIDKWKNEPKFKTKIKLLLYTLFVVIVAVFAASGNNAAPNNNVDSNEPILNTDQNTIIMPENYNYTIDVNINDNQYKYLGTKNNQEETITKEVDGESTNYKYVNNEYYLESNDTFILTTKEEVYDKVDETYINLDTINKYLSISIKQENTYIVYLKDIILGNTSKEYITITKENNIINIDYTNLIKNFDKTITKYIVKYEITE